MLIADEQKIKLNNIFKLANISQEEIDSWFVRLENTSIDTISLLIDFFETFPGQIEWVGLLQKRKEEAMAKMDKKEWDKIIKDEQKKLKELFQDE